MNYFLNVFLDWMRNINSFLYWNLFYLINVNLFVYIFNNWNLMVSFYDLLYIIRNLYYSINFDLLLSNDFSWNFDNLLKLDLSFNLNDSWDFYNYIFELVYRYINNGLVLFFIELRHFILNFPLY
jgi:hypothetical protein